jgi:Na+/H+ antiporter NhaD/arsenite permease-like protein
MLTLSQILAIAIFIVMFVVITIGKVHRYIPALIGGAAVLIIVFLGVMQSPESISNSFNFGQLINAKFWYPGHEPLESRGVNWQTIIFIAGMMLMVEGLAAAGFFRWLCLYVARICRYKVIPIFIAFMVLSGFLSMFIDSITVMLFLASVTIELARLLKFDPIPVIIAEIFAANTGGSATMSGDPPNIIIGTAFGYTFTDFITNTGPIAWAGMIVCVVFFYFCFRKILSPPKITLDSSQKPYPQPKEAITSPRLFVLNTGVFILLVVLLVTHAQTGLSVATIGVIAAILTLIIAGTGAFHIIKKFDWRTVLFFIGLFVVVYGLEETGVLKLVANYIGEVSGGKATIVIPVILWLAAIVSALVDNIPLAATMIPVIANLAQTTGISLPSLAWATALGTDIGGNATPIGASANVVATAVAEKEGYPCGWGRYCKYAIPGTILVLAVCHVMLLLMHT